MRNKRAAQLRQQVAKTGRISVSAFSSRRAPIWLAVVCAVGASVYADMIMVTNTNDSSPGSSTFTDEAAIEGVD